VPSRSNTKSFNRSTGIGRKIRIMILV